MILFLLALLLNVALLTGNEFAVAALIHPSLSRADHRANLPTIQHFAQLYGDVMPVWMGVTTACHLLVCAIAWFNAPPALPWLAAAAIIWVVVIPFSLIFPVPLNNQVKHWDLNNLPTNWQQIRQRWDLYNWIRVLLLMTAFVLLAIGLKTYAA